MQVPINIVGNSRAELQSFGASSASIGKFLEEGKMLVEKLGEEVIKNKIERVIDPKKPDLGNFLWDVANAGANEFKLFFKDADGNNQQVTTDNIDEATLKREFYLARNRL